MGKKIFLMSFIIFFSVLLLFLSFAVEWKKEAYYSVNYSVFEEEDYLHNLSLNVTSFDENLSFSIVPSIPSSNDTLFSLWENSKGEKINITDLSIISSWINIISSSKGLLQFNSTLDNQTGFFELLLKVDNKSKTNDFDIKFFYFIIYAKNDPPTFINLSTPYRKYISQKDSEVEIFINGSDEESHYPLNLTFFNFTSCIFPSWSSRNEDPLNCSLDYEIQNISNTSFRLIFKNLDFNDSGVYNITLCINDSLPDNETLLPLFRVLDYNQSKQTCENITLELRTALTIEDINCSLIGEMKDNETNFCQIRIKTEGPNNSLQIWSVANFSDYSSGVPYGDYNSSWFFPNTTASAENYSYIVNITVSPQLKKSVGFWNITFWVHDTTPPLNSETTPRSINFLLNVTTSNNSLPIIEEIESRELSKDLLYEIFFNVTDDDLLIPDKRVYNETFSFNYIVLNQTNNSQILSNFSNFSIVEDSRTKNFLIGKIKIKPSEEDIGNFTVNLSVRDGAQNLDFVLFNLSIVNNSAPSWNQSEYYFEKKVFAVYNSSNILYINLTNLSYDEDEGDFLTFSCQNTFGGNFLLNETNCNPNGLINFTLWKNHVGIFEYNITVTDRFGMSSSAKFKFNITNENSPPNVTFVRIFNGSLINIGRNSSLVIYDNSNIILQLKVTDFDFLINQKSYLDENLTIKIIVNNNTIVEKKITNEDFVLTSSSLSNENKTFEYNISLSEKNIGNYTLLFNVSDKLNLSDEFVFNLTIKHANTPPIIHIKNLSSAINRTFFYQFNVSDKESGNSLDSLNFSFSLLNLSGFDFLSQFFNETSGTLNISLNSTHVGKHMYNITVEDSGYEGEDKKSTTETFWFFVYDYPNISYPLDEEIFKGEENSSLLINFSVNHTIGDELIYEVLLDNIIWKDNNNYSYENQSLRIKQNYTSNGTNITLSIFLDFSDESYNLLKNLTLIVYPANEDLENSFLINSSKVWKINVSHKNAPILFNGIIPNYTSFVSQKIEINLSNYFSDLDNQDKFYNQPLRFNFSSNETFSKLKFSLNGSIAIFSSDYPTVEIINITGEDLDENNSPLTNSTSNNFKIEFLNATHSPSSSTSTNSGASSSRKVDVPYSLKIVFPQSPIVFEGRKQIRIPIIIINDGKRDLFEVNLSSIVFFNNSFFSPVYINFSKSLFGLIKVNESEEVLLDLFGDFSKEGTYEIVINASVKEPVYSAWERIQITLNERDKILEKIIFAEELIAENPECLELKEIVDRARKLYEEGKLKESLIVTESAIKSCKESVTQLSVLPRKKRDNGFFSEENLFRNLLISILVAFVLGIFFFIIRKIWLRIRSE
ncbi:MAG: hypothetical protein QW273_00665 [Candidatus Pacearchaeota archaeon]